MSKSFTPEQENHITDGSLILPMKFYTDNPNLTSEIWVLDSLSGMVNNNGLPSSLIMSFHTPDGVKSFRYKQSEEIK